MRFNKANIFGLIILSILALVTLSIFVAETSGDDFPGQLEQQVPELMDYYSIPGANIILISEGDLVWEESFGYADRKSGERIDSDTLFRVGSVAKPVVAWGVMKLVEEEKIDLDAPVNKYLESWKVPEEEFSADEVTVRRLLTHTSGLPAGVGEALEPGENPPPLPEILTGELGFPRVRPVNEPGSSFLYSNPGFVLLELVIEEVTGREFEDYMQEEILQPLGMNNSTFTWNEEMDEFLARGHYFNGDPVPPMIDAVCAPGSLYATAEDIARFLLASMSGEYRNGVLSSETHEILHNPVADTESFYAFIGEKIAPGHFTETLSGGQKAVLHGGQHSGWLAHIHFVPGEGEGIVIVTNSERSQHFQARVLEKWAESRFGSSLTISRTFSSFRGIFRILIGIFTALTGWRLFILFKSFISGNIGLLKSPFKTWVFKFLFSAFLLVLWWFLVPYLLKLYLPILSICLGIAISSLAVILILEGFFLKVERD